MPKKSQEDADLDEQETADLAGKLLDDAGHAQPRPVSNKALVGLLRKRDTLEKGKKPEGVERVERKITAYAAVMTAIVQTEAEDRAGRAEQRAEKAELRAKRAETRGWWAIRISVVAVIVSAIVPFLLR